MRTENDIRRDETLSISRLNKALLDNFPYPAMLISNGRVLLEANRLAKEIGVVEGTHCWDTFGKQASISKEDKCSFEKSPNGSTLGIKCQFCGANDALKSHSKVQKEVQVGNSYYDTFWIPIDETVFLHYAIDITEHKNEKLFSDIPVWLKRLQQIAGIGFRIQSLEKV